MEDPFYVARITGELAYFRGYSRSQNPYSSSLLSEEWFCGFDEAQRRNEPEARLCSFQ